MLEQFKAKKGTFDAAKSSRQAGRQQNVSNRLAATGAMGGGVTRTPRGPVASATTSSGAKINKNIKTGVGFGTRASGQKFIKPSSRMGR